MGVGVGVGEWPKAGCRPRDDLIAASGSAHLPSASRGFHRMGMAHLIAKAGSTGWTAEMLDELPDDGNRYEIIDGELFVTPSPTWRHGDAVMELYQHLNVYARAHGLGHVKVAPQDVVYSRRTVVEPDLFVVPLVDGRRPRTWAEAGRLLLAVEVLSPGSQRADRWA